MQAFQLTHFWLMFPFYTLYPLKTPKNLWFFSVFSGYKMGTLAGNGLKNLIIKLSFTTIKKIVIFIYLLFTSQVPILLHSNHRCASKIKYINIPFGSVGNDVQKSAVKVIAYLWNVFKVKNKSRPSLLISNTFIYYNKNIIYLKKELQECLVATQHFGNMLFFQIKAQAPTL